MKASEEVDGAAVVARGDMPKMLEFVEEPFDAITKSVGQGVMRDGDLASGSGPAGPRSCGHCRLQRWRGSASTLLTAG